MDKKYIVSPSPHIHADISTTSIMRDVIIALCPAILVSILVYGWAELLVLAVSVASCVLLEWAVTRWMLKKPSTIGLPEIARYPSASASAVILSIMKPFPKIYSNLLTISL